MPYYKALDKRLHLGYRRLRGKSGTWWCRFYLGERQYAVEPIGTADDQASADGIEVLDFWQAQDKARELMAARTNGSATKAGPLTVKGAVEQYLEWMESNRKSAYDARRRAEAFIFHSSAMSFAVRSPPRSSVSGTSRLPRRRRARAPTRPGAATPGLQWR